MKLTAQVKLLVSPEQSDALRRTIETANAACNQISEQVWASQTFGQFKIHTANYARVRGDFGLTAQVAVRCISKVADAYKLDKKTKRSFEPTGAIAYDSRILRWQVAKSQVSIWTVAGRMTIPFACGEPQRKLLATQQGESDLCFVGGNWMLNATCNVEEPPPSDTSGGYLGVDFGIVNIAVDSLGNVYSGEQVRAKRTRDRKHRAGLAHQAHKHHSKSAYRALTAKGSKLSRFTRWLNHNIAKRIVETALSSRKAIVIEDLHGIRERAAAKGREFRWQIGNWAFEQLGGFVKYKAQRAGVPVLERDPRNSSRECSACGHIDKANRKSQSLFLCVKCGFSCNADANAAYNHEEYGLHVRQPLDGAKPIPA